MNINHIDRKTFALFKGCARPGNIREVQNMVERDVILSEDDTFLVDEAGSSAHQQSHGTGGMAFLHWHKVNWK